MPVIENVSRWLSPILNWSYVLRVRRNHGLEHATIHVLNRQRYNLSGRSSGTGFVIFGDVPTAKLEAAVEEALDRFRKGQSHLAIHPNCGTNLVTTGFLATVVGALGFAYTDRRRAWDRFPLVMVAVMGAILYSGPLGMALQKHVTTCGDMGDTELVSVSRKEIKLPFGRGSAVVHEVLTRGG